jgi:hypothetical protein
MSNQVHDMRKRGIAQHVNCAIPRFIAHAVSLEGQQEGPRPPGGGLGPALQPAGCSETAQPLTLMVVSDEPFMVAPSLAREVLMEQIHGKFS